MRHYEIVFLIHPDWYGFVNSIVTNYQNIVTNNNGIIHRSENWGKRRLAYSIKNVQSAFYILLNIECNIVLIQNLVKSFCFNEAVLRTLVLRCSCVVGKASLIDDLSKCTST